MQTYDSHVSVKKKVGVIISDKGNRNVLPSGYHQQCVCAWARARAYESPSHYYCVVHNFSVPTLAISLISLYWTSYQQAKYAYTKTH